MQHRKVDRKPSNSSDIGSLRSAKFIRSQAEYLFISGAVGLDPKTKTVPDSLKLQIHHIFKNLTTILELAGTSNDYLLRSIVYLTNISNLEYLDKYYNAWLQGKQPPPRTVIVVKELTQGAKVEIDLVAEIKPDPSIKTVPSGVIPKSVGTIIHGKRVSKEASFVFLSGNIGLDPQYGVLVSKDFSQQVKQTMYNIETTLIRANSSLQSVVKAHVYLTDIGNFEPFVKEFSKFFSEEEHPSRTTVVVNKLPLDSLVQIDVLAIEDPYQSCKGIIAEDIPDSIRPFSLAKKVRSTFFFVSGIVGDDKDGKMPGTMVEQLKNIMKKLSEHLVARKNRMDQVLKVNIYVTSIKEFTDAREEYEKWFLNGNEPSGIYLEVAELPKKAKIQIDCVVSNEEETVAKL